jgi:hypothetical protein
MIVFVAGTTAVKAGTARVFFWRGPRRRRQGRHVFLSAGSTADAIFGTAETSFGTVEVSFGTAEVIFGTAKVIFWHGGG